MPTPPTTRLTPRLAILRLGAPLGIACAVAAGLVPLVAFAISPAFVAPAALAALPAFISVAIGVLILATLLTNPHVEPGIAVLASSVVRILVAGLVAAGFQKSFDLEPRPFWFSFLAMYLVILIVEFIVAHRLFNPRPAAAIESVRP